MTKQQEQREGWYQERAAAFVNRESNRQALITVTGVRLAENRKNLTVFFTVLPNEKEHLALTFLNRKRADFRTFLKQETRGRGVPSVLFALDKGEQNRQILDTLS